MNTHTKNFSAKPIFVLHTAPKKVVSKPKIKPPNHKQEGVELDETLKDIFCASFVFLLLGRPGSGKTSLLTQLINRKEFYGNKFDRILYVTPSEIEGVVHDPEINTRAYLDIDWILNKIKECDEWECKNLLLVLDDVVSDIPANQRNRLKTIFYDRRHLMKNGCVSILLTSQKYTCVPMWIRVCLNQFVSFSIQPNEIRTISQELNTGKDNKTLNNLFRNLEKHDFLFFNLDQGVCYNNLFEKI